MYIFFFDDILSRFLVFILEYHIRINTHGAPDVSGYDAAVFVILSLSNVDIK